MEPIRMRFRVDPAIFKTFPGSEVGVIVAANLDNHGAKPAIEAKLRAAEAAQREKLAGVEMGQVDAVVRWRKVYDAFGSPHGDYRSSVEALLRRARAGKPIPSINPLVDLYNAVSLSHHVPVGAEDLAAIDGDVVLTFADGTESGVYLGSTEPENCYAGEVVYRDGAGFLCRRWNWREAERTKISSQTTDAVVVVERAPGQEATGFRAALDQLVSAITAELGGTCTTTVLSAEHPEVSFPAPTARPRQEVAAPASVQKPAPSATKPAVPKQKAAPALPTGGVKRDIALLVQAALAGMGAEGVVPAIARPENPAHGEYATSVAMQLAGVKKQNPITIATELKNALDAAKTQFEAGQPVQTLYQNGQTISSEHPILNVLRDIDHIDVLPPGFLNVHISEAGFSTLLKRLPKSGLGYGTRRPEPGTMAPRVTVEFTDPNPLKEFHIGHLYSNAVGESLARILEANGAEVRRVCYQGDVGMHVAKSLWGLRQKFQEDGMSMESLADKPLNERVAYMGAAYAMGASAFETDEAAKRDMERINALVYIAMQDYLAKTQSMTPHVDYRSRISVDESELATVASTYLAGRAWSLEYFDSLYERLGTRFAHLYFESFVGERGWRLVHDHLADGTFDKSEGAIVYKGEKKGLHTRVFVNALGLPTYEAKELGLAKTKDEDWPSDLSVIVTGKEIDEYFRVLLSAITDLFPAIGAKTRHISHGMIRLPTGKMSSRTGKVLSGIWLVEEAKREIYNILNSNSTNYSSDEKETIAEQGAIAAIKYSLLRVALPMDITFDLSTSVSFDGDSGPYILYTYARCKSVLRKASEPHQTPGQAHGPMGSEERAVARLILQYPDYVAEAGESLSPNGIAGFVTQLASAYNVFYTHCPVIGSDREAFRLSLTAATAQVIANALHLLGIRTVERM